jgi:hypothetical protein
MFLRHRSTLGGTHRATRLNQGRRLRGLRPSSSPQAQRNNLYAVIAQHSPQADRASLVRLLG